MQKYETFTGVVAGVDRANIDTDALIPKEHLKSIKRTGFGSALFSDWRYNDDGSDNKSFIINQPEIAGAELLVTRNNCGCGSSREHAVWAVAQFGFRAIIAPRQEELPAFADIFNGNCSKNGILTIELSDEQVEEIFVLLKAEIGVKATVNLEDENVTFHAEAGDVVYSFTTNAAVRHKLINGLDDIALTLQFEADIAAFEAARS